MILAHRTPDQHRLQVTGAAYLVLGQTDENMIFFPRTSYTTQCYSKQNLDQLKPKPLWGFPQDPGGGVPCRISPTANPNHYKICWATLLLPETPAIVRIRWLPLHHHNIVNGAQPPAPHHRAPQPAPCNLIGKEQLPRSTKKASGIYSIPQEYSYRRLSCRKQAINLVPFAQNMSITQPSPLPHTPTQEAARGRCHNDSSLRTSAR